MRYNFKRLSGRDWVATINRLRARRSTFLEVKGDDLYDNTKVNDVFTVYYSRTLACCKLIYYDFEGLKWKKKLRQISFRPKDLDPTKAVISFRKIASKYNENLPYEPNKLYTNGVYTYFKKPYNGYVTVLDMNSAYLYALSQPLADWETREEVEIKDVYSQKYDFYCFENDLFCEMFYKEDITRMTSAMLWCDVKIYGYKSKLYFQETTKELYRLKCNVNKEKYKNIANLAIGCMHKRSGKRNNTTLVASLYAWFAWYIDNLVAKFEKIGYNVIMVTTDSVKIQGHYNPEDNILPLGNGLGEFKIEYEGLGTYITDGHYEEKKIKWKGMPQYLIEYHKKCLFIENLDEELEIYEKFAIT